MSIDKAMMKTLIHNFSFEMTMESIAGFDDLLKRSLEVDGVAGSGYGPKKADRKSLAAKK